MSVAAPLGVVGFRAELEGASLWDLVQLECHARSRLVVHVQGEGGSGFLYFAEGRIAHAVTAQATGEAAALEILGWTKGSFQICDRSWPAAPTIETPCQALILEAAKRRDDADAGASGIPPASNLVAFPGAAPDEKAKVNMRNPNIEPPSAAPVPLVRGELTAEFPVVLRLGPNGVVLKNKGASEEMAGVVAYAQRLVQLTGEILGLDEVVAIECQFTEGRCLVFTDDNGDTVALRPRPDASLQSLRERLGL